MERMHDAKVHMDRSMECMYGVQACMMSATTFMHDYVSRCMHDMHTLMYVA